MIILLDSGPVGLLAHSHFARTPARECNEWSKACLQAGHRLVIPGIIDYEVRRELTRLNHSLALARLDWLPELFGYLPVTATVLNHAATFWAEARRTGKPTADRHHLDIDMIVAGHAKDVAEQYPREQVVVATSNLRHLRHFSDAREWNSIA